MSRTEQNRTEQNRTEQNRTEQNRTEQNRTEQNRTEQNRKLGTCNRKLRTSNRNEENLIVLQIPTRDLQGCFFSNCKGNEENCNQFRNSKEELTCHILGRVTIFRLL